MNNNELAHNLYAILDSYRKNPYNEIFSPISIINTLLYFIENHAPITMIFPSFHGKINNPNFVISHDVDMGEYIAIKNINNLCQQINAIYPHGVELNLVHEGHFYLEKTELIKSKHHLDEYLHSFRSLIKKYPYLKSYSIYELLPEQVSFSALLEKFWGNYLPSDEELTELITQSSFAILYQAYKKVNTIHFKDDLKFCQLSNTQRKNFIKQMATNQMKIYFGFGKLIKEFFKDKRYIRLSSLYKDPTFVDYISINYLPNMHHRSTPAFNCLVELKNGSYDFVRKHVAIEKGYTLTEQEGLKYFMES